VSARSYWVGLPVGVTVGDDGSVTVEVDMSEASSSMSDEWAEADEDTNPDVAALSENQVLLDGAVVDAHPGPWSARLSPAVAEMRCPVRYTCGFRTFEIPAMAAHLLEHAHEE